MIKEVFGIKKKKDKYRILVKYENDEKLEWVDFKKNLEINKFIFKFLLKKFDKKKQMILKKY